MEKAINRNTVGGKISWVGVAAEMKNERTPHAYECRRHLGYPKLLRAHRSSGYTERGTRELVSLLPRRKMEEEVGLDSSGRHQAHACCWDRSDVGRCWEELEASSFGKQLSSPLLAFGREG